jgi:Ca2+-binding EF-hand superfamily protein
LKKVLGQGASITDVEDNEWDRMLEEVDVDGNGEISFEEFKEMIFRIFNL